MRNESTKQAWIVRLQEHANSGLGIRPWCLLEGLSEASFHYWRKCCGLICPDTSIGGKFTNRGEIYGKTA